MESDENDGPSWHSPRRPSVSEVWREPWIALAKALAVLVMLVTLFLLYRIFTTTPANTLRADDFVPHSSCGNRLVAIADDGRARLSVRTQGLPERSELSLGGPLPSSDYEVYLTLGVNLDKGLCGVGPPFLGPRVDEVWPAVGGRLIVDPGSSDNPVTARLEDLVVRNVDGQNILIGDIELTNWDFGVFAD